MLVARNSLAAAWAAGRGIPVEVCKADWQGLGRAAGPIRNQQMLDEGQPDLVIAFPGGIGTANMTALAAKASVKVIQAQVSVDLSSPPTSRPCPICDGVGGHKWNCTLTR